MRMWFLSKYLCNCDEHELWLSFRVHLDKVGVYDLAIRA